MPLGSGGRAAATVVGAMSLALGLSGCGSSSVATSDEPTPTTSGATDPSASATRAAQPVGRYGVTYEIQDWTDHRDEQAVAGYKLAFEAFGGAVNTQQVTEGMRTRFAKPLQRTLVSRMQFAWRENLHVDPVAKVRVLEAGHAGRKASLTVCHWVASTDFKTEDDTLYGKPKPGWEKVDIVLVQRQQTWRVAMIDSVGRCQGGAPR